MFSTEHLFAIKMKNIQIILNKPVNSGLLLLKLSKILMYVFWYDYVKQKHGEKV